MKVLMVYTYKDNISPALKVSNTIVEIQGSKPTMQEIQKIEASLCKIPTSYAVNVVNVIPLE